MSLILDALRKIELERKAKRQGSVNLRAEVLNYQGVPRKKRNPALPVIAGVALIIAAAALFFLFQPKPGPAEMTAKAPIEPPQAPFQTSAEKTAPAPLAAPENSQKTPAIAEPRPRKTVDSMPRPAATAVADGGNLAVTGIAWQEERNMRRAVVNGALLGEGAEIMGARIVEIRENRVRFSRGGETFEVAYPAAGR